MGDKRSIRARFREAVVGRAGNRCQGPGCMHPQGVPLDAHHITDRHDMPAGGYVVENGIALCDVPNGCHQRAEAVLQGRLDDPVFAPAALYRVIGSSLESAVTASLRLAAGTYQVPHPIRP